MKNQAAFHCLVVATASLLVATLPIVGTAQESAPEAAIVSEPIPASVSQRLFVADKLVLNVYAEPEQGSARVATIQTGDVVGELERTGNQVRVRLEDGREGWVGANYLVSDPPAIVRLRELQRQQPGTLPAPRVDKALMEEIAQLKKENATLRGQVSQLQSRVNVAAMRERSREQEIQAGKERNTGEDRAGEGNVAGEGNMRGATNGGRTAAEPAFESTVLAGVEPRGGVLGWLLALVIVGSVSYASGYHTLARRLRKKFGALKIY